MSTCFIYGDATELKTITNSAAGWVAHKGDAVKPLSRPLTLRSVHTPKHRSDAAADTCANCDIPACGYHHVRKLLYIGRHGGTKWGHKVLENHGYWIERMY